jgi:hypothetical protein
MKKLIKAIVITVMCVSSISSAFSPKEETVGGMYCTWFFFHYWLYWLFSLLQSLVVFTHFFTVDSFLLLFLSLKQPYSFFAKNVARYAKEVVGAKGVTLTKK